MRNVSNKLFQNKMVTPRPKLNTPISQRKNFHIRRTSSVIAGKRVAASYRNHIVPGVKRFAQDNVDIATQRGNIKVVVRVRPPNAKESAVSLRTVVSTIDTNMVVFDPADEGTDFFYHGVKQTGRNMLVKPKKDMKFAFDRVYGPNHENREIFNETIEPIIDIVLEGFNCSVFAYGSTGAGKTYTMLGSPNNPGMTFLTVMELYSRLETMKDEHETEIAVSYLEVYNEMVRDLLSTSGFLNIREDSKGGVTVPNLTLHKPADAGQLMDMLSYGNSKRSQHPTDHNAESSRSHAVFQVIVTLRKKFVDLSSTVKTAKLVMVDLAGSERGSATGYRGQRFREGASINRSLLSLANCINALADGKQHIPYRDSKLTRILKDSLGGNCRTVMIANVAPSEAYYDDTYNTLKYANRAKNIKCQVKKNVLSVNACVAQYAQVVEEMSQKIESLTSENLLLKEKLAAAESKAVPAPALTSSSNVVLSENSANSTIDDTTLETYKILLQDKMNAEKALQMIKGFNYLANFKMQFKQRRVETLEKLASFNPTCSKALNKQKEQIEMCKAEFLRTENLASGAKTDLQKRLDKLKVFEEEFGSSASVSIPVSEYFDLLKGQRVYAVESFEFELKMAAVMLDRTMRQESTIEKGMSCLLKTYMMLRHNNTLPIPPSIDNEYKDVVEELCANRVRWATDIEDEKPEYQIAGAIHMKGIISKVNDSMTVEHHEASEMTATSTMANETYDCETMFAVK